MDPRYTDTTPDTAPVGFGCRFVSLCRHQVLLEAFWLPKVHPKSLFNLKLKEHLVAGLKQSLRDFKLDSDYYLLACKNTMPEASFEPGPPGRQAKLRVTGGVFVSQIARDVGLHRFRTNNIPRHGRNYGAGGREQVTSFKVATTNASASRRTLSSIQTPRFISDTVGEVRAKKPSLTLNLGTNGLKVTSEPPPMAGQLGCLQGQDRSAVTDPSSSHARRCLIRLSRDNRCTRYTIYGIKMFERGL
ncbi:hypothetical protein J6590_003689, partial [Homalodisca vitripennis]